MKDVCPYCGAPLPVMKGLRKSGEPLPTKCERCGSEIPVKGIRDTRE